MELDKKDVEAIANGRFFRKQTKPLAVVMVIVLILVLSTAIMNDLAGSIVVTLAFVGFVIYIVRLLWLQSRYIKRFTNEWLQSKDS